jgi:hypothetical protein
MRPVFHRNPWRIQAHVSISVLALLIERVAEIRTAETWRNLAARLQKIQVVEYDRAEARVQQTTEMRPEAELLLRKLKVALPPKVHSVTPIPDDAPTSTATDAPEPDTRLDAADASAPTQAAAVEDDGAAAGDAS